MKHATGAGRPHVRPYIRPMTGWWKRNPFFVSYMIREATAFAVWLYSVELLVGAVCLAMGEGAWVSQRHADAVLLSGRLSDLRAAFETSARTLVIIRENLFWALAYNLTAVPLAALGTVTPWMAGIGMSASSLVVILNSLRLFRNHGKPAAMAVSQDLAKTG